MKNTILTACDKKGKLQVQIEQLFFNQEQLFYFKKSDLIFNN